MTNQKKKILKLGLFDYPEPSEDFNNQAVEASIDKQQQLIKQLDQMILNSLVF